MANAQQQCHASWLSLTESNFQVGLLLTERLNSPTSFATFFDFYIIISLILGDTGFPLELTRPANPHRGSAHHSLAEPILVHVLSTPMQLFSHLRCSTLTQVSGEKTGAFPHTVIPLKYQKACTDIVFCAQSSPLHWACLHLRRGRWFHTWLWLSTAAAARFIPAAMISPPQINANIAIASEEYYQGASVSMKSKTLSDRPLLSFMHSKRHLHRTA